MRHGFVNPQQGQHATPLRRLRRHPVPAALRILFSTNHFENPAGDNKKSLTSFTSVKRSLVIPNAPLDVSALPDFECEYCAIMKSRNSRYLRMMTVIISASNCVASYSSHGSCFVSFPCFSNHPQT